MTIRPAQKNDQELIRELWVAFEAELPGPDYLRESWEDAWSDLARTVGEGVALIAEEDGRAVGFVFCVLGDRGRKTAHITDIYVLPDARNKGIGRALLAAILEPAPAGGPGRRGPRCRPGRYRGRGGSAASSRVASLTRV